VARLWFALQQQDSASPDLLLELLASAPAEPRHLQPPAWLERVRTQLHDQRGVACSLRFLAPQVGVHPVYLARQFRRYYGCALSDYTQALQVQAALAQMSQQHASLSDIALTCGFSDQSHMSRALRQKLDISPKLASSFVRR
jgi:AraC family transcriptional regulator